ncbi:sterol carrier family protein [Mycobacterium asiaticum]|uniref:sterol carrier family protein n=1 Tax=Mycobacterium asiaticum TaxID=1790 RepID=UPI0009BDA901|nr:sterol carrier family protein [Mycobacterium asiaticum]
MTARQTPNPAKTRQAVLSLEHWLRDASSPEPDRDTLASAVRLTARTLAALAPGASVELRIPPFVAVQCVAGPRHTRGTPPNVVETDPRTWLMVATGLTGFEDAQAAGSLTLSGARASDIRHLLPVVHL